MVVFWIHPVLDGIIWYKYETSSNRYACSSSKEWRSMGWKLDPKRPQMGLFDQFENPEVILLFYCHLKMRDHLAFPNEHWHGWPAGTRPEEPCSDKIATATASHTIQDVIQNTIWLSFSYHLLLGYRMNGGSRRIRFAHKFASFKK